MYVRRYVDSHAGQAAIVRTLDIAEVINREKEQYLSKYCTSVGHSSLQTCTYRVLNPDHQLADYLTHYSCYTNRMLSRFRCQYFGLQVDIERFEQISRNHRVCRVCHAKVVSDAQHFLFECPAYNRICIRQMSLFQHECVSAVSVLNTDQHRSLGKYLRKCHFHRRYAQSSHQCFTVFQGMGTASLAVSCRTLDVVD